MGIKSTKITYFDGSYYSGEVNAAGKEHGKGEIFYANGDHINGTFLDSQCTWATLTKKNGTVYEGQMRDLRFHGQGKLTSKGDTWKGLFRGGIFLHGTITSEDGSRYHGAIENGSRSGYGELKTADGLIYKGYFKRDKFDGHGELIEKDGSKYVGGFRSGEFEGHGVLVRMQRGKKAFQYEGGFVGGVFQGDDGNLKFENGNNYEGPFSKGKKHGKGIFRYSNGDLYEGYFKEDVKEDTNCRIVKANGTTYNGGIANGVYHGHGKLVKANGEYYEGQFQNGNKHGRGKLKTEQFVYQGQFFNDLKHGKAKVIYTGEEKKVIQGQFQNGQPHGLCIERSDRNYSEVTYNQGIKEGPYKKRIGDEYQEQGTYLNDVRHGIIKIKKSNEVGIYRYEQGNRCEELHQAS